MADNTKIEWADATVNAVNGCSRVSPGCGGPGPFGGCYAERLAGTRLRNHPSREGLTKQTSAGPRWTGKVSLNEAQLLQPLSWKRPRRIFWNAHGDLFHDAVPDEWIDRVFAVCALTPQHTHMILTKRSARMREYCDRKTSATGAGAIADAMGALGGTEDQQRAFLGNQAEHSCLPNVWLGVSVEDQARADERIPDLLATPAAVRFISAEPLLGPISLAHIPHPECEGSFIDALDGFDWGYGDAVGRRRPLDWVIAGGESGPGARPMHPDWARSLRDQCASAGTAFHFKQWGEWAPYTPKAGGDLGGDVRSGRATVVHPSGRSEDEIFVASGGRNSELGTRYVARVGKKAAGRLLDSRTHDEFPA